MENIFINQVFKLTEEILRGNYSHEQVSAQLETHLARARKTGLIRYESEVLNTFGVLYHMEGQPEREKQFFQEALQKALESDDTDQKIKLFSNLAEIYIEELDFEQANLYLEQGIAIGTEQNLTTLTMLYLYGNKASYLIHHNQIDSADEVLKRSWEVAENTQLKNYSRYEYLQVIFVIRNLMTMTQIARRNDDAALMLLQHAEALVQDLNNPASTAMVCMSRLYYTLLSQSDYQAALDWEHKAAAALGGVLSYKQLLPAAAFLIHNHQRQWAARYARTVLEQSAAGEPIPATAAQYAHTILSAASSD